MILDEIVKATQKRIQELKESGYHKKIHEEAKAFVPLKGEPFKKAIAKEGLSFICELKKASPSKGIIHADFPYEEIAKKYEKSGASAISCLTEPDYFKGSIEYLEKVSKLVSIPVLRKDFIIDECQIEEAAVKGASAILLIAAILEDQEAERFLKVAKSFGLSALVEVHNEEELRRMLALGVEIIGINHRNLKDFTIHTELTKELRKLVPKDILLVSESGLMDREIVKEMFKQGADGVLIGEMFMRADNVEELLQTMVEENKER